MIEDSERLAFLVRHNAFVMHYRDGGKTFHQVHTPNGVILSEQNAYWGDAKEAIDHAILTYKASGKWTFGEPFKFTDLVIPPCSKLLKDTTHSERSWQEDASHENGGYHCVCSNCLRGFVGHKRRVTCKVCSKASL